MEKVTFFDIVKHINSKDELDFPESSYLPFMINRAFSNTMDSVFFAQEMNLRGSLPVNAQHDFYFYGLPKAKRFGKWHKSESVDESVEKLMNKYKVSRRIAESYYKVMDEESRKLLKEQMNEGGK